MAHEGLADRGGGGELALGEVRFALAHDGEFHHAVVGEVFDLDRVEHLDLLAVELRTVQDLGVDDLVLQFGDLELEQALRFAGGLVLRILGEVALLARFGYGCRDDRALSQRLGEFFLELIQPFLAHVVCFGHII